MESLRFAIVGCGKIGPRHAQKITNEVEGAQLADVCDIIPERAKKLSEQYGCGWYQNFGEMLSKTTADYINICTPSGLHAQHTIAALNSGKNVLCEKPMAIKESDARAMVEAARKNNRNLFVVKQNRYNNPIKLVRKLQVEKKLGRPLQCVLNVFWNRPEEYYKNDPWRGTLALDGGTIYNQVSHFIDLMLMFMGKAKRISSFMGTLNHKIEIEDSGTVIVEFENKAIGTVDYTMCATNKNYEGSITLIFSEGTIKIGGEFLNTIEYFNVSGVNSYDLGSEPMTVNDYGSYKGSASNHDKIFKALVAMHNGIDDKELIGNLVSGEEGVECVRFMDKAIESAKTGNIINLQ